MALVVGTNSWVSVAEATAYLDDSFNAGDWYTSGVDQDGALVRAFRELSAFYSLPATAAQAMKDAQCEQALFLIQNDVDLDERVAIRTMGVQEAGVVKERYVEGAVEVTIAPMAKLLLDENYDIKGKTYATAIDLERDEDADVL